MAGTFRSYGGKKSAIEIDSSIWREEMTTPSSTCFHFHPISLAASLLPIHSQLFIVLCRSIDGRHRQYYAMEHLGIRSISRNIDDKNDQKFKQGIALFASDININIINNT
jgi:hypothetical protein